MRHFILAITISLLWAAGPTFAEPTQALKGTIVETGASDVEVVTSGGYQYVKFDQSFVVASQAEAEVRHVDGQTGETTFIGYLVSRKGYQVYEVPSNIQVDSGDRIVIYSPLQAEDLATVDLDED